MTWFEQIQSWSAMPLRQRMNMLMAGIIVVLCFVIINLQYKITEADGKHSDDINALNNRRDIREAILQAKVDVCNENFFLYLQKNEEEIRDILFEVKEVKQKINGNESN